MHYRSTRHQAAVEYALAGVPVFVCHADGKRPATAHGFKDATTDVAVINGWFTQADYNIAVEPETAGWFVIDEDSPEGDRQYPRTFTVETPRGGHHRYFAGSGPSGVRKLGPHTDTRGRGGYVLVPPSMVGGKPYRVVDDYPVQPMPAWLSEELERPEIARPARVDVVLDGPVNIYRAQQVVADWIKRDRVAIEGSGGDNLTYQCCAVLRDLGLSHQAVFAMLDGEWNNHCSPPWSAEELYAKVGHAFAYGRNEAGAHAAKDPAKTFEAIAAQAKAKAPPSLFHFRDEDEMDATPALEWLVPEMLPKQGVALLVGAMRSYKSFLALDIAMRVEGSFYACLEGRRGIEMERRRAWKTQNAVRRLPGFFVGRAPLVAVPSQCQEFVDAIHARRETGVTPRLIVIDTYARAMAGLNENDARDASEMVSFCDQLAEEFGCLVLVLHHMSKDGKSARGSSALDAACNTVLQVDADNASGIARLRVTKQKDATEREKPWFFRMLAVERSLVPVAIGEAEWRERGGQASQYTGPEIGRALKALDADGVTTRVLAEAMHGGAVDGAHTLAEFEAAVKQTMRVLSRLWQEGKLAGYARRVAGELQWFLPTE